MARRGRPRILDGSQQDFPVLNGVRLAGVLTHDRLFAGLRAAGADARVSEYMETEIVLAAPDEPLAAALARRTPEGCTTLAVLDRGRLVGLVTAENVGELFMLRSALGARTAASSTPPLLLPRRDPSLNGIRLATRRC